MTVERPGEVTFKGNPLTLQGRQLQAGDAAPDFLLTANDLSKVSLKESQGKVRLISVVPSLDTGICDAQTRRFNEEATKLGPDVTVLTVSADLPFAQARWCGAAGVKDLQTLSDHYDLSFGDAYGTHVKELRLDSRAIFVVDKNDRITYVEYVHEIASHPDYEAALEAVKKTAA
ncbi:MAG: thiol peroxidase [Candidatus Hydrogenedentes bacterium]|nr:thiol peroxidase [Candidatus Hydrogenedentota bacterium]